MVATFDDHFGTVVVWFSFFILLCTFIVFSNDAQNQRLSPVNAQSKVQSNARSKAKVEVKVKVRAQVRRAATTSKTKERMKKTKTKGLLQRKYQQQQQQERGPSTFAVIVAYDEKSRGIGAENKIPWFGLTPDDMAHFTQVTTTTTIPLAFQFMTSQNFYKHILKHMGKQNAVIMGRRTFESLGSKVLPKRFNVVISSTMKQPEHSSQLVVCRSFREAWNLISRRSDIAKAFVIGGQRLYEEALRHDACALVICTEIYANPCHSVSSSVPSLNTNDLTSMQRESFRMPTKWQARFPKVDPKTYLLDHVDCEIAQLNNITMRIVEYVRR